MYKRQAQLGFIVITVGHRGGTPMRGKAYHTYGYNNMRDYPLADDKYSVSYTHLDVYKRQALYRHSAIFPSAYGNRINAVFFLPC